MFNKRYSIIYQAFLFLFINQNHGITGQGCNTLSWMFQQKGEKKIADHKSYFIKFFFLFGLCFLLLKITLNWYSGLFDMSASLFHCHANKAHGKSTDVMQRFDIILIYNGYYPSRNGKLQRNFATLFCIVVECSGYSECWLIVNVELWISLWD